MCLAPNIPETVAPAKAITPQNTQPTTIETNDPLNNTMDAKKKGKKGLRSDMSGLQIPSPNQSTYGTF